MTFSELIASDITEAITYAQNHKLTHGDIGNGLYFAFANNCPELWRAIAGHQKIKKIHLLDMMEENDGEMLHVDMVRLWLACKPSRDLKDECLYFVSDGLDLTSIPCINSKAVAHELLAMLIDAGASQMAVLPYLLKNDLMDLAEALYLTQKPKVWLQSMIGVDAVTDEWLLAKLTNLKGAEGSALLYALIECDNAVAFAKYLPLVDVNVPFSKHESLLQAALNQDSDTYLNALLECEVPVPKNIDAHDVLWRSICNPPNMSRLKCLLDIGLNPNQIPYDGATPVLSIAVENNAIDMVKLLLEYGADAYIPRNAAMFAAREQGNQAMEQLLMKAGAPSLNEPDPFRPVFNMPEADDMETLWQAWLDFYHQYTNANPQNPIRGASEARIEKLEKHIGQTLPDDVKTMYRLSEGGSHLFFGTDLFTPEEAMELWSEQFEEGDYDSSEEVTVLIYPKNSVRFEPSDLQKYRKQHIWLIGGKDYEGEDALHLDFTPGETGTVGQIVSIQWNFDNDITTCCRLASNMSELVKKILQQYFASGQFILSPDYIGLDFYGDTETILPLLREDVIKNNPKSN